MHSAVGDASALDVPLDHVSAQLRDPLLQGVETSLMITFVGREQADQDDVADGGHPASFAGPQPREPGVRSDHARWRG
ncbi:hypothetical protein GCM10009687_38840 [Asanoa iriomotensis]|uniref:Uncharacterized protein n=1 Tax=Asanoa iriomotensis TaxID=234613 RepID=A0ABQ4CFC1_9ACTN|nr:hypothetical protein Air01nite_75520 [Asanoa iriomotensis]